MATIIEDLLRIAFNSKIDIPSFVEFTLRIMLPCLDESINFIDTGVFPYPFDPNSTSVTVKNSELPYGIKPGDIWYSGGNPVGIVSSIGPDNSEVMLSGIMDTGVMDTGVMGTNIKKNKNNIINYNINYEPNESLGKEDIDDVYNKVSDYLFKKKGKLF